MCLPITTFTRDACALFHDGRGIPPGISGYRRRQLGGERAQIVRGQTGRKQEGMNDYVNGMLLAEFSWGEAV